MFLPAEFPTFETPDNSAYYPNPNTPVTEEKSVTWGVYCLNKPMQVPLSDLCTHYPLIKWCSGDIINTSLRGYYNTNLVLLVMF